MEESNLEFPNFVPSLAKEEGFVSLQLSPVAAGGNTAVLFAEVRGIKLYQPVAAAYLKELLQ